MPRLGVQVPRLGFQVPRLGFQVPRLGFQVPRVGFQVPCLGSQVPRRFSSVTVGVVFRLKRVGMSGGGRLLVIGIRDVIACCCL